MDDAGMKILCLGIAALLGPGGALAAALEIFKCTAPTGAVAYQQVPCATTDATRVVGVPTEFSAPDPAERERLFRREAALDQRLEAMRERLAAESIARLSRPEATPAPAEPAYFFAALPRRPALGPRGRALPGWVGR